MTKVSIKAIIKHNFMDGKQVVYYRQGGRFYKLLDSKRIVPLSVGCPSQFYNSFMRPWSRKTPLQFVYGDEQVLFKGKPVDIQMDTFSTRCTGLTVKEGL